MIVIAIIAMLAALVTVPMAGQLRGAEVDGAASRVQSTLSDAQAEARETGRPVRVVATVDEKGRAGLACHSVEGPDSEGDAQVSERPGERAGSAAPRGMEHAFARATRRVQLPEGVQILGGGPSKDDDRSPEPTRSMGGMAAVTEPVGASGEREGDRSERAEGGSTRTLAIFLPDGSAVVSGPIRLSDRGGRSSEVRVNPWTGMSELAGVPSGDDSRTGERGTGAGGRSDTTDPFARWR